MSTTKLLIVEDELLIAHNLARLLKKLNYTVVDIVSSGEAAIQSAIDQQPDLVLMDIIIKGSMDGIEAAQRIQDSCNIPVVYITAYADDATVQQARQTGAYGFIVKPFKKEQLHGTIQIALGHHHRMTEMLSQQSSSTALEILDQSTFLTLAQQDFQRVCEYNQLFSMPITFSMVTMGLVFSKVDPTDLTRPNPLSEVITEPLPEPSIITLAQETIIQVAEPVLSRLDYIGQFTQQEFVAFFPETSERGRSVIVQSLVDEIRKLSAALPENPWLTIKRLGAATYHPGDQTVETVINRARQDLSLCDQLSGRTLGEC